MYGSLPIEIAWTVAPGLIVLMLALVIVRTELEVRVAPNPQRHAGRMPLQIVTVIGHQWWWEYIVESDGDKTIRCRHRQRNSRAGQPGRKRMIDSLARPIYLNLQSADVCHSFWVPRLAGKTDLIPGADENQTWFQTTEPGLYLGQCAEYCGTQHANMLLRVYVDTPEEVFARLAGERAEAGGRRSGRAARGSRAFLGAIVRELPHHPRHGGPRQVWSRLDASGRAANDSAAE